MKADRITVAAMLVFMTSAGITIAWCSAMRRMPGTEMPGGWTMSMTWMLMPDQVWWGHFGSFMGMWAMMMVAMMMPVFVPLLRRYRGKGDQQAAALLAAGYFSVWIGAGAVMFPMGVLINGLAMKWEAVSRAVPLVSGLTVVLAGASQFTDWKSRRLACCRRSGFIPVSAWLQGLRFGWQCFECCAGLTAVLLVIGVMDLRVMALVMLAITAERLLPAGKRISGVVGVELLGSGASLVLGNLLP